MEHSRTWSQLMNTDAGSVERMAWHEMRWRNRCLELVSLIRAMENNQL
jgi:hypothetical protein